MAPRKNPLKLNTLQLKTLTLLQEIARLEGKDGTEPGSLAVSRVPLRHGNHFHLGDAVVSGADATGLANPAVWTALERKGMVRPVVAQGDGEGRAEVTAAGMAYDTGLADQILHRSDH